MGVSFFLLIIGFAAFVGMGILVLLIYLFSQKK